MEEIIQTLCQVIMKNQNKLDISDEELKIIKGHSNSFTILIDFENLDSSPNLEHLDISPIRKKLEKCETFNIEYKEFCHRGVYGKNLLGFQIDGLLKVGYSKVDMMIEIIKCFVEFNKLTNCNIYGTVIENYSDEEGYELRFIYEGDLSEINYEELRERIRRHVIAD
jgi:hypothetical protein